MFGKKSRHVRDESDSLLGHYSHQIAATTSVPKYVNPVHSSRGAFQVHVDDTGSRSALLLNDSTSSLGDSYEWNGGHIQPQKQEHPPPRFHSSIPPSTTPDTPRTKPPTPKKWKKKQPHITKKERYKVHRVSYTPQDHVSIIFRMYGSAFPQVFPFCFGNILWTLVVYTLKEYKIIDLTFHSSIGHSFMGLLVSFLVVSRSQMSHLRFMEFRRHLATTYRSCRELVQFATIYTDAIQTEEAKQWRLDVSYRTILMLRVTMDALLWSSTEREKWEEEYFQYTEQQDDDVENNVNNNNDTRRQRFHKKRKKKTQILSEHFFWFRSLTHGRRSRIDENFRAPISFQHVLRQVIMRHPAYLGYKMPVNEYRDLLNFVTIFSEAFHGFRVLVFTPYPFPLVQMTRSFLLFWVYSLPLVLLKEYRLLSSLVVVSLVTFGFIGVEYVAMALDDPFGDETNDVDEHGMALLVYEDIYMALYRTDGPEAAFTLRDMVIEQYRQGRALDCYRNDLKGYEFWEPPHQQQKHVHHQSSSGSSATTTGDDEGVGLAGAQSTTPFKEQ